jgi:U3 small nucleolar RNA-associated protein 18
LTTRADVVRYNSDGQILAIGSTRTKEALRLVHVASRTVFQNWPSYRTPVQYVSSVDFSPNSGYMAIGNAKGKVLLYRLNHYARA